MSLQVWLPLNGDLKNQGLNEATPTGTAFSSNDNGKIGKCIKTTNTGAIDLGYSGSQVNTGSISFGGWFKFNKSEIENVISSYNYNNINNSATGNLIGNHSYDGIGLIWLTNNIYTNNNEFSDLYVFASIRSTKNSLRSTNNIRLEFDTWYHIFFVFDKQTKLLQLWINGSLKHYSTMVDFDDVPNGNLKINYKGTFGGNSPSFNIPFLVNDVRIYDHALSLKEIKEISKGLVLHYPLNGIEIKNGTNLVTSITKGGQTTLLTDGRVGVQTSGTNADTYFTINLSENIVNGNKYFLCCDASGISDGKYWNFPLGQQGNSVLPFKIYNGHNEYWFTANDINWGTNRLFMDDNGRLDWANPACFFNFQLYKIGANTQLEVIDSSGYGNNGLLYQYDANGFFEIIKNPPRYDKCIYVNSENNTTNTASGTVYIYGSCELTNPTQISVAFWCKPIAGYGGNTGQGQFCFTNFNYKEPTVGSDYQASTMNHRDSAVDINDSASSTQCRPAFTPTANEWHHYVVTYDGQVGKVYKDGVQSSTAQFSAAKTLDSCKALIIGFSKAGGVWRSNKSYFSDFRVYVTALSADDVKSLYQVTASADKNNNYYSYSYDELTQGREIEHLYDAQTSSGSGTFTQDKNGLHLNQYIWVNHNYIPINPTGKTYKYDITYSCDAGNQFYIGWERYDANKTSRSNNACVYVVATKPSTDVVKSRAKGTINLSTDGVNPCAFIKIRILNKWTGSDSNTQGKATIHSLSLKEYSNDNVLTPLNHTKQGIVNTTEIIESDIGVSINNTYELNSNSFYEI